MIFIQRILISSIIPNFNKGTVELTRKEKRSKIITKILKSLYNDNKCFVDNETIRFLFPFKKLKCKRYRVAEQQMRNGDFSMYEMLSEKFRLSKLDEFCSKYNCKIIVKKEDNLYIFFREHTT